MPAADPAQPTTLAPGPIDPTETALFASTGGLGLYSEYFAAHGDSPPRAAALIVHGYFEHCGRYREVAHVLARAGIEVLSFDLRGHGRSEGQRGYIDDIADYLDDLDAALAALDERLRGRGSEAISRFAVGHSNGGLVLLRALCDPARRPDQLVAAVLSSPFLGLRAQVPLAKDLLGRAAGRLIPRLSMPSPLVVEDLTTDPQKQEERRLDTLCHEAASASWYAAALEAHGYVAERAATIEIPTLWLVAGSDRIADPRVARAVRARLRAPSRYVPFENMQHEIFNERDRARVFDRLTAYIDEMFPSDSN